MNSTGDATERNLCLGRRNNPKLPAAVLGRTGSPNHALATSLARGTYQSRGWSRFPWLLGMAGLALVTPRTAAQGGHDLAVKTMFRFNPSLPNKDECCGRGWLPRQPLLLLRQLLLELLSCLFSGAILTATSAALRYARGEIC
jgi:hypothetical protein